MKKLFALLFALAGILWTQALEVTVPAPGKLGELLGENVSTVTELTVAGPINAADFETMWDATFNGVLENINLSAATISGDRVPDNAFYHEAAQTADSETWPRLTKLRNISLPEGVTEIGYQAFRDVKLDKFVFPSTLKRIDDNAYRNGGPSDYVTVFFPEGLEKIGSNAFEGAQAVRTVVLPASIREIGNRAFADTHLSEINLPEGLEIIGSCAFVVTHIADVVVPSSLNTGAGTNQFQFAGVRSLTFEEGIEFIPEGFAQSNRGLIDLQLPSTLTGVGPSAFEGTGIGSISLPDGVRMIYDYAFRYCMAASTIVLPQALEKLGSGVFAGSTAVRAIYCKSAIPATCIGESPFYQTINGVREGIDPNTTVYVPAGSAQAYRAAFGWDYFHNFVETDQFPASGVENVAVSAEGADEAVYDLHGRRVAEPRAGQVYIRGGRKFIVR